MIPDYFPPSNEGLRYAMAFVGAPDYAFDRKSGDSRSSYSRNPALCEWRMHVWRFIRAAWGWSYPEMAVHSGTNHSTILTAVKRYKVTNEHLAQYRERLLRGEVQPATINLPSRPKAKPITDANPAEPLPDRESDPLPVVRAPTLGERLAKIGVVVKGNNHDPLCQCGVCSDLNDLARRLAARPELKADDIDFFIRERFIRARSAMGKESAA